MSQQHTLPVTLPPALSQEPLKPVYPPADTHQEEHVKQPTPLPVPCQKVPSGIPGEVPLVHEEKHTTPVKGESKQDCKPQQQELYLEKQQPQESQEQHLEQQQLQQESQEQEVHLDQHLEQQQQEQQEQELQQQQQDEHEDHQEAESLEKQLEEEKTQRELKGQLEEKKKLLDQQLDGELAKGGEQLEKKEKQLLEPLEQQEGKLDPRTFVPAPGQVQETHPVQTLKGEVLPPTEQQQQKQEVQWPPKHK